MRCCRPLALAALVASAGTAVAAGRGSAFVASPGNVPSVVSKRSGRSIVGSVGRVGTEKDGAALRMDNLPKGLDVDISGVKDKLVGALSGAGGGDSSPGPRKPSPPAPFDPTSPEALIAVTKSFVSTDFGVQTSGLRDYSTGPKRSAGDGDAADPSPAVAGAMPFYSSSLLSSSNFVWASGNNVYDGRTGLLTKNEYLAAMRYFDLRRSFPDLEYRAHDFRVFCDDDGGGDGEGGDGAATITVRFTTRTTGTFRGAPLRLRSRVLEPNGRVMNCPPTSVSITYATSGEDRGKIVKLVTDMVLDRQVGNTNGLSGVPAAAAIGEASSSSSSASAWGNGAVPPLVALGRIFGRPLKPIDGGDVVALAPFPESVMVQLAKGVLASNFGLNDPNLLADNFVYLEPLMGPLDKEKYCEVFSEEYNVREGVPDLDYGLENFRVDPYDPYRVWVDTRATGTRVGNIGKRALPPDVNAASYKAPPEAISFTFDDDGFCTRFTAAAVMDPLLGNTGGLGGVYGLLYATGTPVSALKTRSLNAFLNRASKSLLKGVTGVGPDGYRLSDGRVVNGGLLPSASSSRGVPLPTATRARVAAALPPESPPPAAPAAPVVKPFFAAEATSRPTIALPKEEETAKKTVIRPPPPPARPSPPSQTIQIKQAEAKPKTSPISESPADPVTEAFNSAFGIGGGNADDEKQTSPTRVVSPSIESKAQQLRNAAQAARAEAAEAKRKAAAKKAEEAAERQAALDAKLEQQKQEQLKRQQLADEAAEAAKKKKEEMELQKKEKQKAQAAAIEQSQTKALSKGTSGGATSKPSGSSGAGGGLFSFLQSSTSAPSKSPPPPSPAPKQSLSSAKATPAPAAKRSPTISLFDSLKPKPSPAAGSEADVATVKGTAKRSPTISLFGSSPKPKTATPTKVVPKKASSPPPKVQKKKSPTLNILGVGGMPKSTPKAAAKPKSALPVKTQTTTTRSPTINLLKQSVKKGTDTKAKSTPDAPAKKPATKSPTFYLFGGGSTKKSTADKGTKSVTPTQTKTSSSTQAAKKQASGNPFGGLFGGGSGSTATSKGSVSSSSPAPNKTIAKKPAAAKKSAPNGVPVLKQWKRVKDNAVEGRIFGSASFKDGVVVTTSAISKGSFEPGNVVQTTSGSKYFLE